MKKSHKILLILLPLLLLLAAGLWGLRYYSSHIFLDGCVYEKASASLDLRGQEISLDHYTALREQLPECEILWDVPFQGQRIPNTAAELTVSSLSQEDLSLLALFPDLTGLNAVGCRDYPQLMAFRQQFPDCRLSYDVQISGSTYFEGTQTITLTDGDPEELREMLQYLTRLTSLSFSAPTMSAADLLSLREQYPAIDIHWQKEFQGTVYPDDVTEIDLSGTAQESLDAIEKAMEYYPGLKKLILCDCGFENEALAQYRDRVRDHYKVVWSVVVGTLTVRTDDLTYMPEKYDQDVYDWDIHDLVYCEDMLCVDIGHKVVSNVDWIYGMPKLQYLILADTRVTDITPVSTLKDLIYFEVFKTDVSDYSPLLGCTSLQDANLAYTEGDASVFAQMPWLNNLWINGCDVDQETRELLTKSLPDTYIEFDHGWHMGNNWRALLNYFKMRDLLEMPYFDWGNNLGRPGDPGYPYAEEE